MLVSQTFVRNRVPETFLLWMKFDEKNTPSRGKQRFKTFNIANSCYYIYLKKNPFTSKKGIKLVIHTFDLIFI